MSNLSLKLIYFSFCFLFSLKTVALTVTPTTVDTFDITSSLTLDPSCHGHCVIGFCVWLRCTPFPPSCTTGVTTKVRNKNPDFLVTVFDKAGEDPWTEMRSVWEEPHQQANQSLVSTFSGVLAGSGFRDNLTHQDDEANDNMMSFKEVNLYGHPLALAFRQNFNSGDVTLWCPSSVTPFFPYFSSALDSFEWRRGIAELLYPQTWNPMSGIIGPSFFEKWGKLWPRTGFINQKAPSKAAQNVAIRAGNLVTSEFVLPHIAIPVANQNGLNRTWYSGEMQAYNPEQTVWQMIAPVQDTQCYAPGQTSVPSWADGRQSADGSYVFAAWRRYECCQLRGVLIVNEEFPQPICLGTNGE